MTAGRVTAAHPATTGTLAGAPLPLDEEFVLRVLAVVDITEDEAMAALRAVLPLVREYAHAEYERGVQYGDYAARQAVARRLYLGDLVRPTPASDRPGRS